MPAYGNFDIDKGYDADAAIVKYRAVKSGTSAESVAPIAAVTDKVLGVAQFDVTTADLLRGKGASVREDGITEWECGGAVTRDDYLTIDSVGRCISIGASVAAFLDTGVVGSNNAITWTAVVPGTGGNSITVQLIDPSANNAALSVDVAGNAIKVSLATGSGGAITSTAQQVIDAIEAHAGASAKVTAVNKSTSTGASAVAAVAATNLATGAGTTHGVIWGRARQTASASGKRIAVNLLDGVGIAS